MITNFFNLKFDFHSLWWHLFPHVILPSVSEALQQWHLGQDAGHLIPVAAEPGQMVHVK